VLFNSTQDSVLRFLPRFLLQEKHVEKGMRVLTKLLRKKRPAQPKQKCGEPKLPAEKRQ
jgi:acetylornithine/succinyldiaminopimelate/putrescine aminotransferase